MDRRLPSSDKPSHSSIRASGNIPVSVPNLNSASFSESFSCTDVHVYMRMCACLLSSDKSNRVIYTGGKSGLQHSVFSHANISSITDDRVL